jgi:hypothetical protein
MILEAFPLVIEAVYKTKSLKQPTLEAARTKIELIKQLIRTAHEIHCLEEPNYLRFAAMLQEISKMANGWIKYLNSQNTTQNPPTK